MCTKNVKKGFKTHDRHQQKINNREVSGSAIRTINSFKICKIQMTFQNRSVIWTAKGRLSKSLLKLIQTQECISVGCVPPTAVAICWGVSVSLHAGIPPGPGPGDPPVCGPGAPGVGLETPHMWAWRSPCQTPQPSPRYGPEDPPWTDRHFSQHGRVNGQGHAEELEREDTGSI